MVLIGVDASSRNALETISYGFARPLVVHNGIGQYPCLARRKERDNALIVAHVGYLHDWKGWRNTLDGVMLARQRGANVRMVIAGDETGRRKL